VAIRLPVWIKECLFREMGGGGGDCYGSLMRREEWCNCTDAGQETIGLKLGNRRNRGG